MMTKRNFETGQIYECDTPFITEPRELYDVETDTLKTIESWRPGFKYGEADMDDEPDLICKGFGKEIRKIVAIAHVDGGGRRVLYRRSFKRPDGGEFGKQKLRMTTVSGFSAWLNKSRRSFKVSEIRVEDAPQ